MQAQILNFSVNEKDGIVAQIEKSVVYQPKVHFKGGVGSVKWYQDTIKTDTQKKESEQERGKNGTDIV